MPIELVWSDEVLPVALEVLARERDGLAPLPDGGELVLTGAASMPGLLTRGDIDLQLRVPRDEFQAVVGRLRATHDVVNPGIWTSEFATFAVRSSEPPAGIAVTAIGGEHDRRFVDGWRRLAADAGLRHAHNELKRRRASVGDAGAYEEAKADFFSGLVGGRR